MPAARRTADALIAGAPEEVLLRTAAALRGMGARLTRYDPDELTLEARRRGRFRETVIRLRTSDAGEGRARLHLEGAHVRGARLDFGATARLLRRVQRVLTQSELPTLTRRD